MRVVLGPMQGVLDHLMRDLLTDINDYDLCVTEFVRVIDRLLPEHVFQRICPELDHDSQTSNGTPVHIQLLGQRPQWMAENAVRAAEMGAKGIDLNFGCPAKMVNKSGGGALLLKDPELIHQVVKTVREAVPSDIPVTAKIRLGWDDPNQCFEIVNAIENANASGLTIHARTKVGGYKADAIAWEYITKVKQTATIPLTANGEVWNHQDAVDCMATTGCDSLMICRGALNTPNLGNVIKYQHDAMPWSEVVASLINYSDYEIKSDKGLYFPNRAKQWLNFLRKQYPEANELFRVVRLHNSADPIIEILKQHHEQLQKAA